MTTLKKCLCKQYLAEVTRSSSLETLHTIQKHLLELIEERRAETHNRQADSNIKKLRGLMARAGVSDDELQRALSGLG